LVTLLSIVDRFNSVPRIARCHEACRWPMRQFQCQSHCLLNLQTKRFLSLIKWTFSNMFPLLHIYSTFTLTTFATHPCGSLLPTRPRFHGLLLRFAAVGDSICKWIHINCISASWTPRIRLWRRIFTSLWLWSYQELRKFLYYCLGYRVCHLPMIPSHLQLILYLSVQS
jgi:hypothetical protein